MPKQKRKQDQDGLYRRPDSPYWWASFVDTSGKRTRRSTGTHERREAELVLATWRLGADRGDPLPLKQPVHTFHDLMMAYVADTKDHKRSSERDGHSLKHLYPHFSGMALDRVTPQDVRAYIKKRRQEGAGPGTINREIGLFSSAITHARHEWGWNIPNPVSGKRIKEPDSRTRWITRAEAGALIQAAEREIKAPHLADFVRLGLHTGMRRGEMLWLEWRRVDLQAGLIHLEGEHTKTGKRRSVPLNQEARAAIMGRLKLRAQYCPDSPWVFCDLKGKRIQSVRRSFATACRRAGIEDFHIHDMRHTCAAWLVTAGVPLPEVRDLLGHSSISMTEKYAHLAPENVRKAVAILDVESRERDAETKVSRIGTGK